MADRYIMVGATPGVVERVTDDFSGAAGVTLTDALGTAAVTAGKLRLTVPASPAALYYGGNADAPRGVIAVPATAGRRWRTFRVRARVAMTSTTGTGIARMCLVSDAGQRWGCYIGVGGELGFERNDAIAAVVPPIPGRPVDGTLWVELEVASRDQLALRHGVGSSTPPAVWTEADADAAPDGQRWASLVLAGSTNDTSVEVDLVTDWDDLTWERL
jgi:hypothetical protein